MLSYLGILYILLGFFTYYLIQYFAKISQDTRTLKIFNKKYYFKYNDDYYATIFFIILLSPLFYIWLLLLYIDINMTKLVNFFVNKSGK